MMAEVGCNKRWHPLLMRRTRTDRTRSLRRTCASASNRVAMLFCLIGVSVCNRVVGLLSERQTTSVRIRSTERLGAVETFGRQRRHLPRACTLLASPEEDLDDHENQGRPKDQQQPLEEEEEEPIDQKETKNTTLAEDMMKRITQLEQIVSMQEVEIVRLRRECDALVEATTVFGNALEMLREAGLDTAISKAEKKEPKPATEPVVASVELGDIERTVEYFDTEIFGSAPRSVIDAADGAGAAILAGLLGGKQRMLVDVRDAELSRDPETLVQFVELAILPVAAGLEGLKSKRNRVKLVFPTVSQLLEYRKTMALAAPEVVALSTLGFEPVERTDNLVVLVAPSPDDEEGLEAMNELLSPSDPAAKPIRQPLVVINHHMVPVSGPVSDFEVAYHLRLLSVQYMSGDNAPEFLKDVESLRKQDKNADVDKDALEAAMEHARELGMNQGVTRAMVIRAYPKPWHVFVDTSPDTDADFEVAATFDEEPTQDDVNFAIVECLEGSEREDELVAQQMQQALEDGQLDRVANMLGIMPPMEVDGDGKSKALSDLGDGEMTIDDLDMDDEDDDLFDDFELFEEDSV